MAWNLILRNIHTFNDSSWTSEIRFRSAYSLQFTLVHVSVVRWKR